MLLDNQQKTHCYNKNSSFLLEGKCWQLTVTAQESMGTYTLNFKEVPFVSNEMLCTSMQLSGGRGRFVLPTL